MFLRPLLCLISVFMFVNMADAAPFAYVTNAGTGVGIDSVSVIDTSNNSIVKTVPIINPSNPTGPTHPFGVAVSPAGDRVYISNQGSKTISVIDSSRSDFTVIQTIQRTVRPSGLAVNPAGSRLYVANEDNMSVSAIDTSTYAEVNSVTVGNGPAGLAVNNDGSILYVTNAGSGTVSPITTASFTKGTDITVGSNPEGIVFNPSNGKLYVANLGSKTVSVITPPSGVVTVSLSDPNANPSGVAVSGDGSKVYVTKTGSDAVAIINTADNSVATSPVITTGQSPFGVAVSTGPDPERLYVVNSYDSGSNPGTVNSYDPANGNLLATIQVNQSPQGFGDFIGPMMYGITLTTDGNGTITPAPGTDNTFLVASGGSQTFTVTPNSGYSVSNVTRDGSSLGAVTSVALTGITSSHTINAVFALTGYAVTVQKGGTGSGVVTSSPSGINCGATCSSPFNSGVAVTLTATADVGSGFSGWLNCVSPWVPSGNTCSNSNVTGPATVTAFFSAGGPVKLISGGGYYQTIQAALDAVTGTDVMSVTGSTIATGAYTGNESLVVSHGTVEFKGGATSITHDAWDNTKPTVIHGLIINGTGSVKANVVVIK